MHLTIVFFLTAGVCVGGTAIDKVHKLPPPPVSRVRTASDPFASLVTITDKIRQFYGVLVHKNWVLSGFVPFGNKHFAFRNGEQRDCYEIKKPQIVENLGRNNIALYRLTAPVENVQPLPVFNVTVDKNLLYFVGQDTVHFGGSFHRAELCHNLVDDIHGPSFDGQLQTCTADLWTSGRDGNIKLVDNFGTPVIAHWNEENAGVVAIQINKNFMEKPGENVFVQTRVSYYCGWIAYATGGEVQCQSPPSYNKE